MKDQLDTIQKEFETRIASVSGLDRLDELKVAYLGKKGALTALLKGMGQLSPEERPAAGQLVNQVRAYIEQSIAEKAEELKAADPLKWTGLMNSCKAQAEEVVLNELIYN